MSLATNKEEFLPSPELVEKCAEINKQWLVGTDCICEPYNDSRHRDNWKVRVVRRHNGAVVMQHISPEGVHGHTLYLFINALKEQRKVDLVTGRMQAMVYLTDHLCEAVGVDRHMFRQFYNPPVVPKENNNN